MKLTNLKLHNYKAFKSIEIDIPQQLCIFAGINGSGKSSILDAITIALTWVTNRLQKPGSIARSISPSFVTNGTSLCSISCQVSYGNKTYSWELVKDLDPMDGMQSSKMAELNDLVSTIRKDYSSKENFALPMIVLYPTSRATAISLPDLAERSIVSTWELYENALKKRTGFQTFFEWFRVQDDILNEKRLSQEDWMRHNWKSISREAIDVVESLDAIITMRSGFSIRDRVTDFKRTLGNDEYFWYNPRRFFYVLIDLFNEIESVIPSETDLLKFFHEMEHITLRLSDEMEYDNSSSINYHKTNSLLVRLLDSFTAINRRTNLRSLDVFLFNTLRLSTMISFWWLSTKGKTELSRIFNRYEVRFRQNEFPEKISNDFITEVFEVIERDRKRRSSAESSEGRELWVIRKAIEEFVPNYSNLRVSRSPRYRILVDKNGVELSFDQLSDGEKCLIAMIGDIARRLTMANPTLKNPLEGHGVVLIDELELHLHPKWQRLLIERFTEVFPNCQLIATTHSPQIISNVPSENLRILNEGDVYQVNESYGQTSNRILEDIMDTDARPLPVKKELEKLFRLIAKKDAEKSRKLYQSMKELIGDDPELVKADVLIRRLER